MKVFTVKQLCRKCCLEHVEEMRGEAERSVGLVTTDWEGSMVSKHFIGSSRRIDILKNNISPLMNSFSHLKRFSSIHRKILTLCWRYEIQETTKKIVGVFFSLQQLIPSNRFQRLVWLILQFLCRNQLILTQKLSVLLSLSVETGSGWSKNVWHSSSQLSENKVPSMVARMLRRWLA